MAGRASLLMRPNRSIWVQEGNWKVRRQTGTGEKQEQCFCRAVPQIPKSCGTGQTGSQPGCVTTGPTSVGTEGAGSAFPATLLCRKLGTLLPSVFPSSVMPEMNPPPCSISAPLCSQGIPVTPVNFSHTRPRRNGKDWKFHHFVVINIHHILLGLISVLCPKRNQNNLPKTSWITWESGIESTRLHVFPAPCGTRRHWHRIRNYTLRGNKGERECCPNPCEHPGSPRLGNIPAPSITQ